MDQRRTPGTTAGGRSGRRPGRAATAGERRTAPERGPSAAGHAPAPARGAKPYTNGVERPAAGRRSGATAVVRGAGGRSGPVPLLARVPRPRLTALGGGLLAVGTMLAAGLCAGVLLDGSTAFYGVCFVLLSVACALWVRVADALTAPVAVPIAFAAGLMPMAGGEGVGAWFVEVATLLAVNAGWLYGGTLAAAVIVVVRRGAQAASRRRASRRPAARTPRTPRTARTARTPRTDGPGSSGRR